MMATVPHVTSVSGLRKFQADGFLFDIVYITVQVTAPFLCSILNSSLCSTSHSISDVSKRRN